MITATALGAGLLTTAPAAIARPARRAIPQTAPAWLSRAQRRGHADARNAVSLQVYLAPTGGFDALAAFAIGVSTPGTAQYGRFLSSAEYDARFGPTETAIQSVTSWLQASGLHVDGIDDGHHYLSVSGTTGAAEKAFGVTIDAYRHDGQDVQAPSSEASVPDAQADQVLTVTGLDTTTYTMSPAHQIATAAVPANPTASSARPAAGIAPPAGVVTGSPCSAYYGQLTASGQPAFNGATLPYAVCGYTGPQLRAAYAGASTLTGAGVTVAITDAYTSTTIAADAATYAAHHGDPAYTAGQFSTIQVGTPRNQSSCDASGWFGEQALDVEAVHAIAPGAKIRYYAAASCSNTDLLNSLSKAVTENTAKLVSNSWGSTGEPSSTSTTTRAYEQVFLQGAAQGMSFLFSSGDSGDNVASSGTKSVDYPPADPYVTAVGGTSTAINATNGLAFQTGWGTNKYTLSGSAWNSAGFLYGAGGGTSVSFAKPSYQNNIVAGTKRGVPDVAMDADPTTGMLIGLTQTFSNGVRYGEYRIGGTSLASPLFAGLTALSLQHAGHGVGLLNPTIYAQAGTGTFTDIAGAPRDAGNVRVDYTNGTSAAGGLTYSVRTFNTDSSLATGPGWDNVTGIGVPNTGWLTAIP